MAQWHCNGGNWQRWNHHPVTGLIRGQRDPRSCLDNGGSFDSNANIVIWTCNGNAHQRFDVNPSTGVISVRT